jgi:putative DNA primase/helicase
LDYITKVAPTGPGGDCPIFLDFLDTIFGKDHELVDYLQKFFGYILTGETTEHVMLFFYGTGANGKSVLISTIAGILGDYHRVAPIDTFTATNLRGSLPRTAGMTVSCPASINRQVCHDRGKPSIPFRAEPMLEAPVR